jgi:proteasome lid subunit RPN8/RPN11
MIKIKEATYLEIMKHTKSNFDIESCGYVGMKNGVLSKVWRMTNMDSSPTHFSFCPKEQLEVLKDSIKSGFRVSAIYHSHLNSKAFPSKEDIKFAYDANMKHMIVSLIGGNDVEVGMFEIKNNSIIDKSFLIL